MRDKTKALKTNAHKDFVFTGFSGKVTLAKCGCAHYQQDEWYGNNVRVHNLTNEGRRCTVCNTLTKTSASAIQTVKKGGK